MVFVLAVINCFWRLSSNEVSDLDEARYGVAASEMLRAHSWLVATYGDRPELWNLKPPLGYWMQELSFQIFGPTIFALRLPAAVCGLAVIALTMRFCRQCYGRRAALLAGLILTTCFGLVSHHGSRSGDLDSALTLIMLLSMIQVPALARSSAARILWAGTLALGFLLKSFAILPFVLIAFAYLYVSQDWRSTRAQQWIPAVGVFCAIVLAWILARCSVDGSIDFVKRMFYEDLLQRSTQTIDGGTYKPWGYAEILLDRFAPWPLFIIASLTTRRCCIWRRESRATLPWLWAMIPFILFSVAETHHHWYLDPSYPAWSMLAALAVLALLRDRAGQGRVILAATVVIGLMFCESRILFRVCRKDGPPANQTFLLALRTDKRIATGSLIVATFRLSHSERFILEVVDGYRVSEPDLSLRGSPSEGNTRGVFLLSRQQQAPALEAEYTRVQLLARGAGYCLMQAVTSRHIAAVR